LGGLQVTVTFEVAETVAVLTSPKSRDNEEMLHSAALEFEYIPTRQSPKTILKANLDENK
jgi:hypothetical protein